MPNSESIDLVPRNDLSAKSDNIQVINNSYAIAPSDEHKMAIISARLWQKQAQFEDHEDRSW